MLHHSTAYDCTNLILGILHEIEDDIMEHE